MDSFWERAEECIERFDYKAAATIYREALKQRANDPEILDALGDVLLLNGDAKQAHQVLTLSLKLAPNTGASKFLNLGQLSEGQEAIKFYKKGIELLNRERNTMDSNAIQENREKMVSALCALAEIYMTDECMDESAEEQCEKLLSEALSINGKSPEALQLMASFKVSQQNNEEALEFLQRSKDTWIKNDPEDQPSFEFRLQAAKIFIELEQYETAAEILEMLLEEFDEISEVWYLLGFSETFFDPESALESLAKSRELLVKTKCEEPSIFEQVDNQITRAKEALAAQQAQEGGAQGGMDTTQ